MASITVRGKNVSSEYVYGPVVEESIKSEQKRKNIFRKLTKRKRRDEECESNKNKKPMLILTFVLCLIVMAAGGSVKMK